MELADYLEIINRRKFVIIVTVLFTVIVVVMAVLGTPVEYTATTTLRVLTTQTGGTDYIEYDIDYTERLMETYVVIAKSTPLIEDLSAHVYKLPIIEVSTIPNTELITISAVDEDASLAQFSANKLAEILISNSRKTNEESDRPDNIYVVEPALIPTKPSSTNPWAVIGLGFLVGLIGGFGLAFIYENLDTKIYNTRQIENVTDLPVIGDIPDDRNYKKDVAKLYTQQSLHVEAFRRLHTNIFSQKKNSELNSILITSAVKKDGRSMISANLALSIASTNRKVLLIDADMRSPSQHKIFDLENANGLSDILSRLIDVEPVPTGHDHTDELLKKYGEIYDLEEVDGISDTKSNSIAVKPVPTGHENLDLIPAGPSPSNPVELLNSWHTYDLLKKYGETYDIILIDAPSCLQVTDSAVISAYVDGVLFVLRNGWVREEALLSSINQLKNVNTNVIGLVANRTTLGASELFRKKSRSTIKS